MRLLDNFIVSLPAIRKISQQTGDDFLSVPRQTLFIPERI